MSNIDYIYISATEKVGHVRQLVSLLSLYVCIYIYIYIYIHTHTHIYIYIYIECLLNSQKTCNLSEIVYIIIAKC